MANIDEVQVFIDAKMKEFGIALKRIAELGDTSSDEYVNTFGPKSPTGWTANGWRVAEKMREIALDALSK